MTLECDLHTTPTPVGIDLGSTYSAVAVIGEDGHPRMLHNSDGQTVTPSVVLFEQSGAVVGQQAKLQRAACSDDVVEFVQRQMGNQDWRFIDSAGAEYTAEAISAIILTRLAGDASLVLGETVHHVVVTVPAYFDEAQRNATRHAGAIAGLEVLAVVDEPTAAAVSFGLERDFEGTALVFDLGGGTFDVSMLRAAAGQFEIDRTEGDRNLGGFDFDNAIIGWAAQDFKRRTGIEVQSGPDLAQLRDRAEQAKHRLSTSAEVPIYVTADGRNEKLVLTRQTFEEISSSLLTRTEVLVEEVLETAGLVAADIDHVLLVGGSTRMPMVPRMLQRLLGRRPDHSLHPDEAVARGAAIFANLQLKGQAGQVRRPASSHAVSVIEVVSYGFGVVTLDADTRQTVNSVLIPANTTIPCQGSETYFTVLDSQTQLDVQVTEGDERDLRYTKALGNSVLTIPPYPKGAPVRVTLSADIDAILHIEVTDLTSGRELGEFEVDRQVDLDQSELAIMRETLAQLEVQ